MGSSKTMRSAQLLCVCCLFMASASSQCAGDESCIAEKDAAVLLQSTMNVVPDVDQAIKLDLATEIGDEVLLEEANACGSKDFDDCMAVKATCTWSNAQKMCKWGCSQATEEWQCPDYCIWRFKDGSPHVFECSDHVQMNIGGSSSGVAAMGTPPKANFNRPQFKTSLRTQDGENWVNCGGTSNCFYGSGQFNMRAVVNSPWKTAAVEFAINCELKSAIQMIFVKNNQNYKNTRVCMKEGGADPSPNECEQREGGVKFFYNLQRIDHTWDNRFYGPDRWGSMRNNIPIDSEDEFPTLRVELSPSTPNQEAIFEFKAKVTSVTPEFENCMDMKSGHKQCLEDLASTTSLRSSHEEQTACIVSSGTANSPGCSQWYNCLNAGAQQGEVSDSLKVIQRVNNAFHLGATPQATAAAVPALGAFEKSTKNGYWDPESCRIKFDKPNTLEQCAVKCRDNGQCGQFEVYKDGTCYIFPHPTESAMQAAGCSWVDNDSAKYYVLEALYVKVGAGTAGPTEIWSVGGATGKGARACYEAVMAESRCEKDYFTYVTRGDKNCGCKGAAGSLSVRNDVWNAADYFKIESQAAWALAQTRAEVKPTALAQTQASQNRSRATCHAVSGVCINPSTVDVEAFDCNCFDWIIGKTDAEINLAACNKPQVCCHWKESHNCDPSTYAMAGSHETNLTLIESESTMRLRSQQEEKDAQDVTSLDDSLSGKRECEEE